MSNFFAGTKPVAYMAAPFVVGGGYAALAKPKVHGGIESSRDVNRRRRTAYSLGGATAGALGASLVSKALGVKGLKVLTPGALSAMGGSILGSHYADKTEPIS